MSEMTSLLGAVFYYSRDQAGKHPKQTRPITSGSSRLRPVKAMASFNRAASRLDRS